FDAHVAADRPTRLLQPLKERRKAILGVPIVRSRGHQHADAPYPIALLRARRERPRCRRAAEQRHELASFQWLMSPVLPIGRIAHLGGAEDLLHCGISSRAMAAMGQIRSSDDVRRTTALTS